MKDGEEPNRICESGRRWVTKQEAAQTESYNEQIVKFRYGAFAVMVVFLVFGICFVVIAAK